MATLLTTLLITIAVFILSALPLFFAVKFMGGRTGIIKVIIINFLVAIVSVLINLKFQTWGGLLAFITMLFIYKFFFRIGWIRALLAWLLQFVFATIIVILAAILFGITLFF